MELLRISVLISKHKSFVETQSDLEYALTGYIPNTTQIYINVDVIKTVSSLITCKEAYEPHNNLGKYFKIHCNDGSIYYAPEDQFHIFDKFVINDTVKND